ncbi:hypothetical protein [Candidatus Uabimicrobium sp. HlEnr_7]|uniref:hypothetical protein n=1 Tax=Candidatus Uabimicrobium helgolandensis TaxID=3095367 RepID=UPI003557A00B
MLCIESTNSRDEFNLINRSIAEEYKYQICAMAIQKKKEKFFDLLTNDKQLTTQEREKIFDWIQQNINMVIM